MWGSLRSSSGSTFGDVQNRIPSSQGESSSQQSGLFTRPRVSISNLLSGSVTSTNPENVELESELDTEAVTHIDSFFGNLTSQQLELNL